MQKVVDNCNHLAGWLKQQGVNLLTGGTDNHLLVIDLSKEKITGQELEKRLESVGIITNKNAIPFDTKNKRETSGLRIGTAAITSRGLGFNEIEIIATIIAGCINDELYIPSKKDYKEIIDDICKKFPLYR